MIKIGKRLDNLKKKERSIWERKHNSHTTSKSEQRVTGGGGGRGPTLFRSHFSNFLSALV